MFTFTAKGRGRGVYTKLRLINEIKSYVTYLIANSKSEIYFFSNIEIGSELSNPHLHSQIWSNDKDAVSEIYSRVIKKFELVKKRCSLSLPQQTHKFYNYVIKDYSKDLSDNQLWNLEQTKKRMRKTLGLKLRFYSRSKSKYQNRLYKIAYRYYGVLRENADKWLDFILPIFFNKEAFKSAPISSFITIKNKEFFIIRVLKFIIFRQSLDILFYSPSLDPPLVIVFIRLFLKGVIMIYLVFILVYSHVVLVMYVEVRCLSPPFITLCLFCNSCDLFIITYLLVCNS